MDDARRNEVRVRYRTLGPLVLLAALTSASCSGGDGTPSATDSAPLTSLVTQPEVTTTPATTSTPAADTNSPASTTAPGGLAETAPVLEIMRGDLSGQTFVDHLSYDEQNDQFVAHPLSLGSAVWTSEDGVTWTRHDNVEFETDTGVYHVEQLVETSSGYMALGSDEPGGESQDHFDVLWKSDDSVVWTQAPRLQYETPPGITASPSGSILPGPDGFIMVGETVDREGDGHEHRFAVWTSQDAVVWELVDMEAAFDDPAPQLWQVMTTGQGYVAQGGGAVWRSDDGSSWSRLDTSQLGPEENLKLTPWGDLLVSVAYIDGTLTVYTSVDETTFQPLPGAAFSVGYGAEVTHVAAGDFGLVIAMTTSDGVPTLMVTRNGNEWTVVDLAASIGEDSPPENIVIGADRMLFHRFTEDADVWVMSWN